jgi:NAD(P)-dependent dehydrogenase (short-subunit alcohol dehydrogenase family)
VILVNNAATAGTRGVTDDGFELAFAVNYLSHFLLTSLLRDTGLPIARVINVASNAHLSAPRLDPDLGVGRTRSVAGWREYSHSKAALVAMTVEMGQRYPATTSLSVHPGVVATGLWRRIPRPFRTLFTRRMLAPGIGALPVVQAVTDRSLPSGSYLTPEGVRAPGPAVLDAAGRARLWDQSVLWVQPFLAPSPEKRIPQ